MSRTKRYSDRGDQPQGIAVVELAICLPILVLMLIATIEACVMLQVQHNLAVTAYEGTRIGIMPGTTAQSVHAQCQLLLDDRNITGYTVTLSPADPSTLSVGDAFTVTVQADCADNAVWASMFFEGKTLNEAVVMLAE